MTTWPRGHKSAQGRKFNLKNHTFMKSLEEILQEYFGCKGKNPFLKKPRKLNDDGDYEYFTKAGAAAYGKLTALIEDLEGIGVIDDSAAIIFTLDEIVREE